MPTPADILALHQKQFREHPCPEVTSRLTRLGQLKEALLERENEIREALWADFQKPAPEVQLTEITATLIEIDHAIRHLKRWTKPQRKKTPIYLIGTGTEVIYYPKGPSLIVAPWNYAILLTLGPVVHATAAGCPFVVKPSENTPRAADLLKKLIESVYPPEEAAVFTGNAEIAQELLSLPFSHIHFTGSTKVGKMVMEAGAKHLASVTLELGGKSPTYVDSTADLKSAARGIGFGKFSNAGQTCIAPDYVLIEQTVIEGFLTELRKELELQYGKGTSGVAGIVSRKHFERQREMINGAVEGGASIEYGGEMEENGHRIAPTVLTNVPADSELMHEEIFGPILPLISVSSEEEAIDKILSLPPPLSTYVFSRKKGVAKRFSRAIRTGAVCTNTTLIQFVQPFGPFGGEGNSGIGRSHGEAGFRAFSNEQVILRRRWGAWILHLIQPPYGSHTPILNRIFRWFT